MKPVKWYIVVLVLFFVGIANSQDLTLTGNLASNRHYIDDNITVQGPATVNSGVELDLVSKTKVVLSAGFKVMPGGVLRAATSPDTDGDTIHDIVEQWSDCLDPNLPDTDDDGLADNQEDTNGNGVQESDETSACNADTDGDKMDDKWELDHNFDPLIDDGSLDADGDGVVNYLECHFNTDPRDQNSLPLKGTSYYEYDQLGRIKKIIRIK